ncbi:bifunctional phosphopantothenoylcysteine decarboxylase/phosphopantothenate--cysteine ligase CoaBC [Nitratireductor sp. L1-7-SE]|uniref:Coenzyme A biosynthesis bifunctional protein CoaBC n=1 Tax=Nitratireductor rhodophyticola TaxID=2854036 RepID=A0ABS7R8A5_9HYPH|nr:bifunctional phosphopantothenoylcysteine decarboxylase/phosphopantothenate--cysteine ligase CoaBC [Nitratireductor rhodophyticola]MBY8916627.1 bifunctional phosphopantothenoylcysteine decarboxylase/phosphopantothenate--cysteine ligase CoaBC [Nitratireductor rhodophyticola]MBY8921991.1 bifunctional phosphopantothenoylcysteine decarboxylase/phosphopantothenate--cysteine ligase CoaBC [Nitratireductor rhodophyticola]
MTAPQQTLRKTRILLLIGGGIAAYKCLDLIRRLRERGASVRCVMTRAAQEFITPLSVGALSADHVFTDLFDRQDEHDVGHIRLSREADLLVVAPATADLMAKLATGQANDLASTVLLATDKPVLMAPAMNPHMWEHPATQRNARTLREDGVHFVGPNRGEMAESGEAGEGRMAEPMEIVAAIEALLDTGEKPLAGRKVIVTSGPTHEVIDPVRYIANRSSGKQGHAIAAALAHLGASVHLVSGPVSIPDPQGVTTTHVETARQMREAVEAALPADAGVFVAAVADWRPAVETAEKIKKKQGEGAPTLELTENPDILAGVGHHEKRPALVIGFAAETQDLFKNARAKLNKKGADIIVANDVSHDSGVGPGGVMGGDRNSVVIVSQDGHDEWPEMGKDDVAERLAQLIADRLGPKE